MDGKWRWVGGTAESRYHHHARSDNNQLLFTISFSEEVEGGGREGGRHRGNHLTKGWPPARLIIPRILLAWPSAKAREGVLFWNKWWAWKEIQRITVGRNVSSEICNHLWHFRVSVSGSSSFLTCARSIEKMRGLISWREQSRPAREGTTICSSSTPVIWLIGSVSEHRSWSSPLALLWIINGLVWAEEGQRYEWRGRGPRPEHGRRNPSRSRLTENTSWTETWLFRPRQKLETAVYSSKFSVWYWDYSKLADELISPRKHE